MCRYSKGGDTQTQTQTHTHTIYIDVLKLQFIRYCCDAVKRDGYNALKNGLKK